MSHKVSDIRLPVRQGRLTSAVVTDDIDPSLALEILYYAGEPDLVATMRAIAVLDTDSRLRVLSFAQSLAQQTPDVAWAESQTDA